MFEAILDLATSKWEKFEDPSAEDIAIGFKSGDDPVAVFSGLRFGWVLWSENVEISFEEYPKNGVSYEKSDQRYITCDRLSLEHETPYKLVIWAENNGIPYSTEIEWVSPKEPEISNVEVGPSLPGPPPEVLEE